MAYRLTKKPTFTRRVNVIEPGDTETGDVETSEFVARFTRISDDELNKLLTSGRADKDIMQEVLVGWSDLTDENGAQVPFNNDFRDALLSIPHAVRALTAAFVTGASGAGLKN